MYIHILSVNSYTSSARQALLPMEWLRKPSGKVNDPGNPPGNPPESSTYLSDPPSPHPGKRPGLRNKHLSIKRSLKRTIILYTALAKEIIKDGCKRVYGKITTTMTSNRQKHKQSNPAAGGDSSTMEFYEVPRKDAVREYLVTRENVSNILPN